MYCITSCVVTQQLWLDKHTHQLFVYNYVLSFLYKDAPVINVGVVDQTVNEGDTAFFTCQATGTPIPKISWYLKGAPVMTSNIMKYMISELLLNPTTKNNTLKILTVSSSDIGTYTCNATNIDSSDTSSGILTVNGKFASHK